MTTPKKTTTTTEKPKANTTAPADAAASEKKTEALDTKKPAPYVMPDEVLRRNVDEAQWRTLCLSLFPGARVESVVMVIDYCRARGLDPMKKPCHIVPMEVKIGNNYEWRDVVMPGIYEHRTTAMRTGKYLGHSKPEYGPEISFEGLQAPEWCDMTMYRHHFSGKSEFPVRVYFAEVVATKSGGKPNARWTKAPRQMLTKCTEAAGLREAFPDELGGTSTVEEMEGHRIEGGDDPAPPRPTAAPRLSEKRTGGLPAAPVEEAQATETGDTMREVLNASAPQGPTTEGEATLVEEERQAERVEEDLEQRDDDPRVGVIVKIETGLGRQKDAAVIELSTGFKCSTRVAERITACQNLQEQGRRVELTTTASSQPNTMDRLEEILPL